MKNKIWLFLVSIAIALGSCITPRDTNFLQDIEKNYPKDDIAPVDYEIIPGDQLVLSVFSEDKATLDLFSMYKTRNINNTIGIGGIGGGSIGGGGGGLVADLPSNVLSVYANGTINIPHVGEVEVQGLTINEAKKIISDRCKALHEKISVDVALRNRFFYVLGEAGSRSVVMSSMRMTIYQALAQSGAITLYGNRKSVKIVRQTAAGTTEVKSFDLRSQDIVNSDFYYIQPNDVIYVEQMQRRFWGGITSFSSIFGFVTGALGMATLIIKLVK